MLDEKACSRVVGGVSRESGAALLADSFGRLWERGERSVDAANDTGAFRLYERAGMTSIIGWILYENELVGAA